MKKKSKKIPKFLTPVLKVFSVIKDFSKLCLKKYRGSKVLTNFFFQNTLISFLIFSLIESYEYKNHFGFILYLIDNPVGYLVNYSIIFSVLLLTIFVKRRIFLRVLISIPFILLGIVNGSLLSFRMTPFTVGDLSILDLGIDIALSYLTTFEIVLYVIMLVSALLLLALIFIFAPKSKQIFKLKFSIPSVIVSIILSILIYNGSLLIGATSTKFINLWDAYKEYGVVYSFLNTWLNQGIKRPADYSKANIENIFTKTKLEKIVKDAQSKNTYKKAKPNIIFLQLESFIDPEILKNLKYSKTPTPFFKKLKKDFPGGTLTVPVFGGGTSNTEFECQTGLNINDFGPGEYPYRSVLKNKTVETFAYNLKTLNYKTHIMHNHRAMFYDRNKVFPNMGYDDFTPLEYMLGVQKVEKNWTRDMVLLNEMLDVIKSTKERDYLYTISVQAHGEYSKKKILDKPAVKVLSGLKDESMKNAYEYFLHQANDVDNFLEKLINELNKIDEETVLVLFGDHLPALDISDEDTSLGSILKTEYVLWSNFDMGAKNKNLHSYDLPSYIQSLLGMKLGVVTNHHLLNSKKTDFLTNLKALGYDILYGDKYSYLQKNLYKKTNMKMGFRKIYVLDVVNIGGNYFVKGVNFTPFSSLTLDGKILDSTYMSENIIALNKKIDITRVKDIKVSQLDNKTTIISTTE